MVNRPGKKLPPLGFWLCACSLVAAAAVANVGLLAQQRRLALTHANVVDVANDRILPNQTVVIEEGEIVDVTEDGMVPAGAQVVDAQGKFLMSGLWDMHAHVQGNERAWMPLYLANGVIGIRDMGADLDFVVSLRAAVRSGETLGPQVIASGPILDDAPGDWPFRIRVRTADDARAAVQLLKRRGVDLVKVHNFTPREAFFAIVDEARRQQLPVAGHVPLRVRIPEAVDAGMATIEHMSEDGRVWKFCSGGAEYRADACRPLFEMLARRGVWQTPTLVAMSELLTIGTPASSIDGDQLQYANKTFLNFHAMNQSLVAGRPEIAGILEGLARVARLVTRDMAAAGVGLLAGCDALIAGFCVHDELEAMVAGGLTPAEALQTATLNPARYLGREATSGSVARGKSADLLLLDSNPLDDIASVRRIHAVVAAGRFLDRAALDRLLDQARVAAQQ